MYKRQLDGRTGAVIDTRPHALRRVLVNLVDNALKFAGAARLEVERRTDCLLYTSRFGLSIVMWMSCGGALLAAFLSLFLRETAPAVLARQRSAPTSVLQGNQP